MSSAEKKRLGINNSTLWYQRRKLANNKKTQIYSGVIVSRLMD